MILSPTQKGANLPPDNRPPRFKSENRETRFHICQKTAETPPKVIFQFVVNRFPVCCRILVSPARNPSQRCELKDEKPKGAGARRGGWVPPGVRFKNFSRGGCVSVEEGCLTNSNGIPLMTYLFSSDERVCRQLIPSRASVFGKHALLKIQPLQSRLLRPSSMHNARKGAYKAPRATLQYYSLSWPICDIDSGTVE